MKRDRHFESKIALSVCLFTEQLSGEKHLVCEIITVVVKRIIEVALCFYNAVLDLLGRSAQDVITGGFELRNGFAGRIVHIDVAVHQRMISFLNFGSFRNFIICVTIAEC